MRLNEIFDTNIEKEITSDIHGGYRVDKLHIADASEMDRKKESGEILGYGVGGYAVKGEDPHEVKKITHVFFGPYQMNKDGYRFYVSKILEKAKENPHFPRIFNIKKTIDPNGSIVIKYDMEKLYHIGNEKLNSEMLYNMANSLFNNFMIFRSSDKTFHSPKRDGDNFEKYLSSPGTNLDIQKTITLYLKNFFSDDSGGMIKDETFLDALNFINEIQASAFDNEHGPYQMDVHGNNMMIRITPIGYQLVLTDLFV